MLIFCYVFHVTHGCIYAYVYINIIYSAHFFVVHGLVNASYQQIFVEQNAIATGRHFQWTKYRPPKCADQQTLARKSDRQNCSQNLLQFFFLLTAGFDNIFKLMQMVWQGPQGRIYLVYSLFTSCFFQHGCIRFFFSWKSKQSGLTWSFKLYFYIFIGEFKRILDLFHKFEHHQHLKGSCKPRMLSRQKPSQNSPKKGCVGSPSRNSRGVQNSIVFWNSSRIDPFDSVNVWREWICYEFVFVPIHGPCYFVTYIQ